MSNPQNLCKILQLPFTVYDYDDFENSVIQVSFINSWLHNVPNSLFSTFKNLQAFNGSHMALKELNSLSFNKADYLQYIFLQNNHLTDIRDHVFVHCKYLKCLDLSKNRIKTISKNAFNSLEYLEQLNLSGNKLKKIEHDIFEPLISIEYIWLNHNQLQEISSNYFTEQNQKLISIYLNNNKLTAISPYAFDKLDNLRFLFLKGNKCVNADFKNYQISSNVAIKYEMKNCIKTFRKAHPEEEKRFDLTAMINEIEERMELCKTSIDKFLEVDKTMLDAIQKFNYETEQ